MVNKLERLNQSAVSDLLAKLETKLNADVFTYYGEIVNGVEREVKDIIENLAKDDKNIGHCMFSSQLPEEVLYLFKEWWIYFVIFMKKLTLSSLIMHIAREQFGV